ncbi:MAG TPA: M28 family peptidase [Candidatus Limnocylindrales bacterium]|nr:M28 family peptidase [Candidatus Limnocylindrales bacterium]
MRWTGEPRFADPDAALVAAAAGWRAAVDPDRLRQVVESLPAPRSRLHAPEAMAATDELILAAWRGSGWSVDRQELRLQNVAGSLDTAATYVPHVYERLEGVNLVAELPGETREAIVVVAHHDTVRGSPGADDNGAGVAAILELARLFAGRRLRHTLVLAAPDFEELGIIGSRSLVPWLQERYQVLGAIVFDVVAYVDSAANSQRVPPGVSTLYPGQTRRLRERATAGDTVMAIYRDSSTSLVGEWGRCLAATIGRERILLLRDPVDLPLLGRIAARVPAARNFSRSDHVNFWRAGLPAIHVTDTGPFRNPNYHLPSDTPDTLDYATLADIVATTALVIERLAD